MNLKKIVKYLDEELCLKKFAGDCSNNGLQIEGKENVEKIIFGVDGCLELFEAAAEKKADMVIVHHGISWGGEPRRFSGFDGRRLKLMFQNDISLYGVHLPLDAHAEYGNNAQLCKMMALQDLQEFFKYGDSNIGFIGELPQKMQLKEIAAIFENKLGAENKIYGDGETDISRVAVVSGGGGSDGIVQAAEAGADLLVTGEFSHQMYHLQRELGVQVLALGHYASETVGVKALMPLIREKFAVECEFVDIPTGL